MFCLYIYKLRDEEREGRDSMLRLELLLYAHTQGTRSIRNRHKNPIPPMGSASREDELCQIHRTVISDKPCYEWKIAFSGVPVTLLKSLFPSSSSSNSPIIALVI